MKKILAGILALTLLLSGCSAGGESAQTALENALMAVKNIDLEGMNKYYGGNILDTDDHSSSSTADTDKSKEMVRVLISKFSYEIMSVEETDAGATGRVECSNIDVKEVMEALLPEMLAGMFANSLLPVEQQFTEEEFGIQFSEGFKAAVENPDAALMKTEVEAKLMKNEEGWKVEMTNAFLDAVMGGYLSYGESLGGDIAENPSNAA